MCQDIEIQQESAEMVVSKKTVNVTKPYLPDIDRYIQRLQIVWDSRVLTNGGGLHNRLEAGLAKLLHASHVSLVNNGTIALQIALQALEVKGRVITTPYSFVATANAIKLSGLEPVFIDLADNSFNMDPELIERACTKHTKAVMPVHVYGIPCDNKAIQKQVDIHRLKVVYDAAHAFSVRENGCSILDWGDCSVLSFHATKVFHTFEGGAIIAVDPEIRKRIEALRNFGFVDGDVELYGTNGKMNEAQAAMGLVLLNEIDDIIAKRRYWHERYCAQLQDIGGITLPDIPSGVGHNYAYYPVLIQSEFPLSRDDLFERFIRQDIFTRKYFHPLITDFSLYKNYPIISKYKIPNARRVADSVICLPLYPDLCEAEVGRVCDVISHASKWSS